MLNRRFKSWRNLGRQGFVEVWPKDSTHFLLFFGSKKMKSRQKNVNQKKTCGVFFSSTAKNDQTSPWLWLNDENSPIWVWAQVKSWLSDNKTKWKLVASPAGKLPGFQVASRSTFRRWGLVGRWIFLLGPIFRGYVYIGFGEGKCVFFFKVKV